MCLYNRIRTKMKPNLLEQNENYGIKNTFEYLNQNKL